MSNCVNITNRNLLLKSPEFDVVAFKKWYDEQPDKVTHPGGTVEMNSSFWYFIKDNTTFSSNLKWVEIAVGRGHSTHTERDFKWLIWTLNQFVKAPIGHKFGVSNEFDNHKTRYFMTAQWPYKDEAEFDTTFVGHYENTKVNCSKCGRVIDKTKEGHWTEGIKYHRIPVCNECHNKGVQK